MLTAMLNNIVNPKAMSKKENKEQDILKAAEMLFAEKGFKGATTTLIAAQAGVTHAMLHYYFRTKDQIFLKVFDAYLEEILQSLKSIMVTDMFQPDLIRKTTEICFDFFSAHSGQLSLLLEVAKERPDLMESYVSKIGNYMSSALDTHKKRTESEVVNGRIRNITFEELIGDIVSVCAAPFFFDPLVSNVLGVEGTLRAEYLEARKKEAVELIVCRLFK